MRSEEAFPDSATLTGSLLGGLRSNGSDPERNDTGWIVLVSSPDDAFDLASRLKTGAANSATISASWHEGFLRPYGALLDVVEELAAWTQPRQPELLQRFGWSLINLLYPWRKTEAALPVGELRAGLADLVFRGDQTLVHQFFQKRNVRPQILSYLIHFLLEATTAIATATSKRVLLCLDNAQLADELSLSALQLLNRYARNRHTSLQICLIATRAGNSAFDTLLDQNHSENEWRVTRLEITSAGSSLAATKERLTSEQRAALEVMTVFGLPLKLSDWIEILPTELRATAETSARELVASGILHRLADDRLRFANGQLRDMLAKDLPADARQSLHARALAGEGSNDAFVAAWHAAEGGCAAELRSRCLQAMERAWAVSAYETALTFAERALAAPVSDTTLDENLLLAMLNYEAGRYDKAHQFLRAAMEQPTGIIEPNFLEYLLGYNAVFGLGDYKQGIEILSRVLSYYEQKGDERGTAYIRNSLAFAHFCSRNVDEAITLEELNIEQLGRAQVPDSFLGNVLALNLGRLYRTAGEAERALKLLREGLDARKAELSSHALLLYYGTLGNFQFAKGDYQGALEAYYHSFEIIRNVQLDSVKDQVLLAFSKRVPELPPERTTRADLLLYYVHFHLGLTCQKLGLRDRAATYLTAIRQKAGLFGTSVIEAVEAAFSEQGAPPVRSATTTNDFDRNLVAAMDGYAELVSEVQDDDRVNWIVNALHSGQVVGVVRPHNLGQNCTVMESLVVYNPRYGALGERMSQELESGGSHITRAPAAVLLPEAAHLFQDISSIPLVQQSATLKREYQAEFPALLPVKLCVQVLSAEFDDFLFNLVEGFAAKNGHGLTAVAPFHLWRRDLVSTPQQALPSFLVSSIDALLIGDRLLRKDFGPVAMQNLLNFRPRLSEEALVINKDSANGKPVLIRIKRRGGYATDDLLKLHPGTRPILDLCDGNFSVAEITKRIAISNGEGGDEQLCAFLRSLWHRGALCFDEPML